MKLINNHIQKIVSILILLLVGACQENEEGTLPCDEDVLCTMNFVTISLKLTDKNGDPVALDEYYSKNLENRKTYNFQDNEGDKMRRKSGRYPILTDSQNEDLSFNGTSIKFVGYINNEQVFSDIFIIGRGCCHIGLLEGDLDQKIDLPSGHNTN